MNTNATFLTTASIVPDEGFQPRRALNEAHVQQLMVSDPDTWPPLTVALTDDGLHFLIDGFHRYEAATRLGLGTLACIVDPDAGYPEAFAANQRHGLSLTIDERKDFVRWLVENEHGLSFRELGRRSGLNHQTVKRALTESQNAEPVATRRRAAPDPIEKLVRTVVTTYDAGHGRSLFGLGRGGNANVFRKEIATYGPDDQPDVARALLAFGHAAVEAAQPFLSSEEGQV